MNKDKQIEKHFHGETQDKNRKVRGIQKEIKASMQQDIYSFKCILNKNIESKRLELLKAKSNNLNYRTLREMIHDVGVTDQWQ